MDGQCVISRWAAHVYLHWQVCLYSNLETSCISWGQSCVHGELGHGEGKPRSATNAVKVDALEGSKVLSVSCGAGNTVLLLPVGNLQLM